MRIGSLDLLLIGYDVEAGSYTRNDNYKDLELSFDGKEWDSVFIETLGCPDEVIEKHEFEEVMKEYPMLGRIWDMYEDIVYAPDEIRSLSNDCLRVKAIASSSITQGGLRKLLYGCDEAMRTHYGLLLASD